MNLCEVMNAIIGAAKGGVELRERGSMAFRDVGGYTCYVENLDDGTRITCCKGNLGFLEGITGLKFEEKSNGNGLKYVANII